MRSISGLFSAISIFCVIFCACESKKPEAASTDIPEENLVEEKSNPSDSLVKEVNLRYHFEFSRPASWQLLDVTDNNDGFVFNLPDKDVEIRVFGELVVAEVQDIYEMLCDTKRPFSFQNHKKGTICEDSTSFTYYLIQDEVKINFYIPKSDEISDKEKADILFSVRSLKFTETPSDPSS